jgi:hypothetical protein
MFVVPMVLFVIAQGRGYYTAPLYPMLLAAGAARLKSHRMMWVPIAIGGVAAAIVAMPITPMHSRAWEFASKVNGDLVEEIGWPELVAEVNRIYHTIPPEEHAAIFCANYGEAGAVDLYGPQYGLPHAISNINTYWLRGPGNPPPRTLVFVGGDRERLEQRFESVVLAGHTPNPYRVENEETTRHPDIFICRRIKVPIEKLWPTIRSFG